MSKYDSHQGEAFYQREVPSYSSEAQADTVKPAACCECKPHVRTHLETSTENIPPATASVQSLSCNQAKSNETHNLLYI